MVHGLAASIRAATENEVFDLAGQSAATISTVIRDAFAMPRWDAWSEAIAAGADNIIGKPIL